MDEKDFLREMKIVNETQADLGLTAIPSSAVLDIMCQVGLKGTNQSFVYKLVPKN